MHSVNRLIDQFVPENYQLSLELKREEREFGGIVTMTGTSKLSGRITVHSKDLDIKSVTVDGKAAEFYHGEHDELTVTHPDITEDRQSIIVFAFSGTITDSMQPISLLL